MDGRLTTLSTNGKMSTRSRLCLVFIFPGWQWGTIVNNGNDEDKVIFIRFTLEQYKSAYCNVITNTGEETLENFWEGGRRTFWFLCERWNWRLNVFSLFNSKLHLQYSKMTSTDVRHNYFLSLAKVEWIFLLDAEELLLNENSSQSSWGQNVNTVHWNQFEQNNIHLLFTKLLDQGNTAAWRLSLYSSVSSPTTWSPSTSPAACSSLSLG